MNEAQIVRRETATSIVINMVLSAGFFLAFFGLSAPAPVEGVGAYAFDFLPQAFMIALMGSLVPALLTSKRMNTGGKGAIVLRSLLIAVLAAALLGGGAYALLHALEVTQIEPYLALGLKIAFGAVEALVVTPGAVRHALVNRRAQDQPSL